MRSTQPNSSLSTTSGRQPSSDRERRNIAQGPAFAPLSGRARRTTTVAKSRRSRTLMATTRPQDRLCAVVRAQRCGAPSAAVRAQRCANVRRHGRGCPTSLPDYHGGTHMCPHPDPLNQYAAQYSPHHADVRRGGVTWLARRAAPGRPVVNRDEVARTRGLFLSFLFGAKKKTIGNETPPCGPLASAKLPPWQSWQGGAKDAEGERSGSGLGGACRDHRVADFCRCVSTGIMRFPAAGARPGCGVEG